MKKTILILTALFLLAVAGWAGPRVDRGPAQSLEITASPTFAGETLTGLTASKPVFTDANKALTSSGTVPADQLPVATSTELGGVKPDGTSILNTAGAISATAASVGADPAGTAAGKIAAAIYDGDLTHAPDGNSVYDALDLKAPLASPNFTGSINRTTPVPVFASPTVSKGPAIITSFTGTISRSGTTLTFSEAADAVFAGYSATNPILGTTVIHPTGPVTMYITAWLSSTTATVDSSGTLAAQTPTSVQLPITAFVDSAGVGSGVWNAAGKVGIGTTNPGEKLQVSGDIFVYDGSSPQTYYARGYAGTNSYHDFALKTNGATRLTVGSDGGVAIGAYAGNNTPPVGGMIIAGNVGIGTSSPTSGFKLDVNGGIRSADYASFKNGQYYFGSPPSAGFDVYMSTTAGVFDIQSGGYWRYRNSTTGDVLMEITRTNSYFSGNLLTGGLTAAGTSAAKVLAMGSGTAPTTVIADGTQEWSADYNGTAGDARKHFMGEGSAAAATAIGSGKVSIKGAVASQGGFTRQLAEATSGALSGASGSIAVNVPSGARILGVQLRVDTLVTSGDGATSWTAVYVNTPTTAICSGQAFAANTKFNAIHPAYEITTGTVTITITPNSNTFSGGVIRGIVYYEAIDAMASL